MDLDGSVVNVTGLDNVRQTMDDEVYPPRSKTGRSESVQKKMSSSLLLHVQCTLASSRVDALFEVINDSIESSVSYDVTIIFTDSIYVCRELARSCANFLGTS